ncbi:MAG: hypothetical protein AAF581_05850 [Planctomycetota bacterium]
MASSRTLVDVLDAVERFHHHLGEFYGGLIGRASREDARIFLDLLRRHELDRARSISRYKDGAEPDVLSTWIQFSPSVELTEGWQLGDFEPDISVQRLTDLAVGYDRRLKRYLRVITDGASQPRLNRALRKLVELEEMTDAAILAESGRMN